MLDGLWQTAHDVIDDLLHRADAAMYQAKQSGKGRFALDL